ncbi:MAG: OB-fold domain-containing protein [Acidimicrobiales bacterium]|nr:OB-fold domain-containing protein [Acidimicrobiales bacterium]MCB9374014.1 OB-fold domain-containing protein [Microthrixaceae bacterium]
MASVPFAPDVFTWPADEPQLVGGRCGECGSVTFPQPPSCARCGSTAVERHLLPRRGTLWTFTTQEFLPKEPYASGETPETFRPYGVGLVQLGDEVRVEGRLTTADVARLEFGMEMEVVVVPFRIDADGTEVVTYAFAPVDAGVEGADQAGER